MALRPVGSSYRRPTIQRHPGWPHLHLTPEENRAISARQGWRDYAGYTMFKVADDGTIVNLADMKPQTTDSHCSAKPVRYVLEMNLGWFAKKNIKAGFKLGGKPFEAAK